MTKTQTVNTLSKYEWMEMAKKIQIIYLNQLENYRKVKTKHVFRNIICERSALRFYM